MNKKLTASLVLATTTLLYACGGGGSSSTETNNQAPIPDNAYFEERLVSTYAYQDSAFSDALQSCVYSNQLTQSCSLGRLPLIAQTTETPDINDIMNRVVVSHDWMAERFEQFLQTYDELNDFKNLLRATTAIVISSDVRPSFYWAATGAIYLDPENLWLTPQERDTIDKAPDYRSGFGNDLQFVMPWRYVKDNDYASFYYPEDQRVTRELSDIRYRLSSLLYHELAHANDYFPASEWLTYSDSSSVLEAALDNAPESTQFAAIYPLSSEQMLSLARVSFHGEQASAEQMAYQPSDISVFFKNDHASDYYNYSDKREDYAMLFEELMMASRFAVYRDVAVTNSPSGDNVTARDYIVEWGQRIRIAQSDIKPRARYVTNRILPEFDADSALAALPQTIEMVSGNNWVENLDISPINTPSLQTIRALKTSAREVQPMQGMRYIQRPLPRR
jgi:hypothetical protein